MTTNAIIIRTAEAFLKGGRRGFFISRLKENLSNALRQVGPFKVREEHPFLLVLHENAEGISKLPPITVDEGVRAAISRTFGVAGFSPCRLVAREISQIEKEVEKLAVEALKGASSFKVQASRSDKQFPLDSMEINRRLGALVHTLTGVPVRLKDPDVTLHCHIMRRWAALYLEECKGPSGLPVGTSGHVLLLLSGGIDSPVAGWLAMRRGCTLDAVHFEALPYTTMEARKKVLDHCQLLSAHEPSLTLHIVPFGAIQATFADKAPGRLLVILYRRMMLRIASEIGLANGAEALVTGDNLGQVASQTLRNLAVIEAASRLMVLRPLLTYDKAETIEMARRLGTYDISIRPYDDCCSLFVPPHPETWADLSEVEEVEKAFDIEGMVRLALATTQRLTFVMGKGEESLTA